MGKTNLPSVTVETFTQIVKMQLEENNYRPIFGLGKGGIGKSESLHDLAVEDLKIGYIDIRLLLYTETDLKGIPYPNTEHSKTIWLQNDILPNEDRDGKKGILVLDEITSAARSVRTAAYQLLNERKLGEYKLPDEWLIVCLGNGEEDGGDYQGMEGNFANRCSVYEVVPNLEAFKIWAFKNGVHPLVSGYVSFKPQDLHSYNPESETDLLFASPRSWAAVSDILNKHNFDENNKVLAARIVGNLGQNVGYSFLAFCKYSNQTVDPMLILNGKQSPVINTLEVVNITVQSIIKILGDKIKEEVYQMNGISEQTVIWLANGLKWILSLKKELAVMGFKDLISYDMNIIPRLVMNANVQRACPELIKFATENAEIFK